MPLNFTCCSVPIPGQSVPSLWVIFSSLYTQHHGNAATVSTSSLEDDMATLSGILGAIPCPVTLETTSWPHMVGICTFCFEKANWLGSAVSLWRFILFLFRPGSHGCVIGLFISTKSLCWEILKWPYTIWLAE